MRGTQADWGDPGLLCEVPRVTVRITRGYCGDPGLELGGLVNYRGVKMCVKCSRQLTVLDKNLGKFVKTVELFN